ncbi:MAG: cation-translocating P-type ATPase [Gemmatimonadales bacterium]|nr:MAG: cation-translocating P-type ATPase [Gemmatimonadales bacterium]
MKARYLSPMRSPFLLPGFVGAMLLAGGLLQWIPEPASPWRWLPFALAYGVGGIPIARDTWASLREGRLSIDFLMGAAALGAAVVGEPFEGVVLIFLFSLSNALETLALGKTRRAVESLMDLRPDEATLLGPDGEEVGRVPVEALEPGNRVRVRPGERLPADGRVAEGSGEVDQAAITGESVPVRRTAGDEVFAGTILSGGALVVEVTRPAHDTLLARIVRLVEEARANRAPAQHFIDRFAHPYTLGVVGATALMALLPPLFFAAEWTDAFYRAMTLLVVASPCALIISTPAAILSGIANGARHGILFKGGAHLDRAGTIDTLAFDKTGTLTVGRPVLVDLVTRAQIVGDPSGSRSVDAAGREDGDREGVRRLIQLSASLERDSEHHLARAILEAARERDIPLLGQRDFRALPGEGVTGAVNGETVWVGNETLAERMGVRPGAAIRGWLAEETSRGRSVIFVGTEDEILGALAFGDELKPNAEAAIRHLKYEGIRWITVLSGDHPDAVRAVAATLGVDEVKAGLLPHQKVEALKVLAERSRGVAMVGDGVNDAPAMAASSLGIAMGAAGTDVAIETADVVLMGDDITKVDYVIHLGKRARRVVRQNVWFSVGWMAFLVLVTVTVGMPLTLAVVAHEGSTLLVALNGLRLLRGGPHPPTVPT